MKKPETADFPKFEQEMLKVWEKEKTFAQSLKQREDQRRFSFYDGPPFANGLPHYGHVLAMTLKDAVTRYKGMRGYYVPRRLGWDTHGLPVEYEVEKQLELSGKPEILKLGIDKFNQACRDSVFRYKAQWEELITRMGRWADQKNSYATLDDDYIESVWWVFAQIDKQGLVYQGFKSMPYCPRCATPLSNFEVNQNYKDNVEDPSVYPTFPLVDQPDTALLAWTTTPWTLPANAALAIDKSANYVTVRLPDESKLILAEARLEVLDLAGSEYKVVERKRGSDLVGLRYQPLYQFVKLSTDEAKHAYRVYADENVDLAEGTGILHMAPRYGEADLAIGQREGLPLIESVDSFGRVTKQMGAFAGLYFKEADQHIISDLTKQGRIFIAETARHTYPFCWRCESPLMYFATPSWFVKVTELTDRLVANNRKVNWVPSHIKEGRFGNWLAEARDWSISRNRFWGAPIPIWRCPQGHTTVVGSLTELKQLAGLEQLPDLHRPGIDRVELTCEKCGQLAKRIEEVFDCWFESGSMPYAQDHYPFEHQRRFEDNFPADFIAEGLDQTRGWFYTLHVLAAILFDQPAFKNVIVNGLVLAADGQKLSKRLRNYPEPEEIFSQLGADSLRLFLLLSPSMGGEDVRFSFDHVREIQRNIFMTLWNVYSFLATYAEAVNWRPAQELAEPVSSNLLDQWMLSRLNQTIAEVTKQADKYQVARATRPLIELIDDLSNWYLRRSRRRFRFDHDEPDRQAAFATLHYVLIRICQLLAPWTPFISDKIWRELNTGTNLPTSVHLSDWPDSGTADDDLLKSMALLRQIVSEGLAQRAEAKVKVRQPLGELGVEVPTKMPSELMKLVGEEVNVKKVSQRHGQKLTVKLNTEISSELIQEGLVRDVIRHVQSRRKQAGLRIDDPIKLRLSTPDEKLGAAIKQLQELLKQETQARELELDRVEPKAETAVKVGDSDLFISVDQV